MLMRLFIPMRGDYESARSQDDDSRKMANDKGRKTEERDDRMRRELVNKQPAEAEAEAEVDGKADGDSIDSLICDMSANG